MQCRLSVAIRVCTKYHSLCTISIAHCVSLCRSFYCPMYLVNVVFLSIFLDN